MKRLLLTRSILTGATWLMGTLPVLANAPGGEGPPDYSGITGMYYVLIGLILAYGIYDTFLKKS